MSMLFHSTRGKNVNVTAKQAIRKGIADDGGLFVTDSLGEKTVDVANLPGKSYQQIAKEVLGILLDDFSAEELDECINSAYGSNFSDSKITPVREVGDDYVLELFHGPTSAFKDIALQILPEFLARAGSENSKKACERIMILTATSGDTGKAALDGFAGTEGTGITVFYPEGKVSEVQRMQMVAQQGDNVAVCAVRGNFDDAQSSVKEIFADKTLADELEKSAETVLSSANSINVGRLVPQVVYYFAAYSQLLEKQIINVGDEVQFCVPTGNFGDILAGYYAKRMGLPVSKLIVASDKNNVLFDFFKTGVYDRNRPFYTTTSPSMDILISSNLERMLYYFSDGDSALISSLMNDLKTTGRYEVPGEIMDKIRQLFECGWADEEQVANAIADCRDENSYVLDPHTACAYHVLSHSQADPMIPRIMLSTASPYKFPRTVLQALGEECDGSDFECMDRLEKISGVPAVRALRELENAKVRFADAIDVKDMPQYVLEAAKRMANRE